MKHSTIPSAQLVVQHCKAKNIKNIVISPGSRNAPLIIGFTENDFFKCFSIVDERSAAFFALGIAQQSNEPVAVVCTSGSALLNYYPAVAEAYYSAIPLVVISADRPVYKIDVGDGQTIRQDHVFDRHIGYSANLRQDVSHSTAKVHKYAAQWVEGRKLETVQNEINTYNNEELHKVLDLTWQMKLPVHINVPFEEPLYDFIKSSNVSITVPEKEEKKIQEFESAKFVEKWNKASKKMVLVGVNPPHNLEQHILDSLAKDPSIIVLTETTSNLNHSDFFSSIDSLLVPIEKSSQSDELFKNLQPEILVTLGGLVVSKKVKAFLREYKPKEHWHVNPIRFNDTYFALTAHVKINANEFFTQILQSKEYYKESDYHQFWKERKLSYERARERYLKKIAFCDLKAYEKVIEHIPNGYRVQLSNSSTVRYAQLFDIEPSLSVFCNRGTSGIDGSTSTAVGASLYGSTPTLLITGDLSFFYDSNGLWNKYLRADFRIILFNNNGGGIFRILPGKEETSNFETFFETTHDLSAEHISKQFGLEYSYATDEESLTRALKDFYLISQFPKILEISTPRLMNNKILLGYFDFIS